MSRVISSAFGMLLGVVMACLLFVSPTHALSTSGVVISVVQTGDTQSSSNEIIEIYNDNVEAVDVTNWCVYYASASSTTNGTKLACLTPSEPLDHIFLNSHTSVSFASKQYVTAYTAKTDYSFSATLSGTAGHVRLVDTSGAVVDKVGWGTTALSPEGLPAIVPSSGKALSRMLVDGVYVDTDNNLADFQMVILPLVTIPVGQTLLLADACGNIDGLQLFVPSDMTVDDAGNCAVPVVDQCTNIIGVQADIPMGYELRDDGLCWRVIPPLTITEVLPNPVGADANNEFIELYNSSDQDISLTNDVLKVGVNLETSVKFTHGETVSAHGYFVMKNDAYSFTLLNSSDLAALQTADGQTIDQILPYINPDDGYAWALIDGTWQYTNQPTPGAANLLSLDSVDSDMADAGVALAPCAANQYRNPATGRCKLLSGQSSTLVPCKADQYRSEETGRCRAIATTAVPKACPAGQERNADTNRCRKAVSSTPPKANYAVLGASTTGHHNYVLWAVLGVLGLGIGYAIWEWHDEITKSFRRAVRFIGFVK